MVPGGGPEAGVITKGQLEGAVWSDGTILYPSFGGGYTNLPQR